MASRDLPSKAGHWQCSQQAVALISLVFRSDDRYPIQLTQANYTAEWQQWSAPAMDAFLQSNSNEFPIAFVATTDRNETCVPGQLEFCYGGCMLHELPAASDKYFRDFAGRIVRPARLSVSLPVSLSVCSTDLLLKYQVQLIFICPDLDLDVAWCRPPPPQFLQMVSTQPAAR